MNYQFFLGALLGGIATYFGTGFYHSTSNYWSKLMGEPDQTVSQDSLKSPRESFRVKKVALPHSIEKQSTQTPIDKGIKKKGLGDDFVAQTLKRVTKLKQSRKPLEAVDLIEQELSQEVSQVPLYLEAISIYANELRNYERENELIDELLAIVPDSAIANALKGYALSRASVGVENPVELRQVAQEARPYLIKAIRYEREPHPLAHIQLASNWMQTQDYAKANEQYELAIGASQRRHRLALSRGEDGTEFKHQLGFNYKMHAVAYMDQLNLDAAYAALQKATDLMGEQSPEVKEAWKYYNRIKKQYDSPESQWSDALAD